MEQKNIKILVELYKENNEYVGWFSHDLKNQKNINLGDFRENLIE